MHSPGGTPLHSVPAAIGSPQAADIAVGELEEALRKAEAMVKHQRSR